jgi:hypothetical protein
VARRSLGSPSDAAQAFRRVSVGPIERDVVKVNQEAVLLVARSKLSGVPGSFDKGRAQLGMGRSGAVELEGELAYVAEYGVSGRGWWVPRGRVRGRERKRISNTTVSPPRFGSGRPGPEDGWVIGAAWKMTRRKLSKISADETLDAYMVELDSGSGAPWRGKVGL